MLEEPRLAFDAAGIPCQTATGTDHPVTWHDDCQRVLAVRATDRANCPRHSHRARLVAVRHRRTETDCAQNVPRSDLESRALRVENKIKGMPLPREVLVELSRCTIEMIDASRLVGDVDDGRVALKKLDASESPSSRGQTKPPKRRRDDSGVLAHFPMLTEAS